MSSLAVYRDLMTQAIYRSNDMPESEGEANKPCSSKYWPRQFKLHIQRLNRAMQARDAAQ